MVYHNAENLPDDVLAHALFENAILNAQNFSQRVKGGNAASDETIVELTGQMVEYAFAIETFYLVAAGKEVTRKMVMTHHENFFLQSCGVSNSSLKQQALDEWRQEIQRKISWLGLGHNVSCLDKDIFARNIMNDTNLPISEMQRYSLREYADQFVCDVQSSMEHFGVAS